MNQIKISPMLDTGSALKKPLTGVGGLLILFIILLGIDILMNTFGMIDVFSYNLTGVNLFFLSVIIIGMINEVVLSAFILYFLFRRKIIFRLLYLIQTCVLAGCTIILLVVSMPIFSLLVRLLWTVYLYQSERVRNTFVLPQKRTETITQAS